MPISGPAMVAHGYKPNGYYKNPNVAFAAGSSMALLQIRAHLRGRVRASPKWLLNKPIAIKPSYMGQIGYTVPGNEELGLAPGVIPTLNINQPGSMAARYSVPNTRLGFDSLHAQAMSKVAPTVGTTSWLVRPVFDFDSSNKDVLNKLLYKAQIQRAAPPPAYEQVPMWPSQPPRPLFD